jgi:hypothetical protein
VSRTPRVDAERNVQSCFSSPTALAGIASWVAVLFLVCILCSAGLVKPTGTSFCEPGLNAVMTCPCSNSPAPGGGCGNYGPGAIGQGAVLTALGNASVTDGMDTLQFQVTGENDTALTVLLQASSTTSGVAYGAGVSCLGGPTLKLYHGHAGGPEPLGQLTRPLVGIQSSVHARSAAFGDLIAAGQTRYYMAGYRDPKAAWAVNCNDPMKTFNSSQGVAIVWTP